MVAAETGDGDVTADAAVLVEEQGVRHRAHRLVDVAGGQPLEEGGGASTGHFQALECRHVVHRDGLAGGLGLGSDDGRPVARRPLVGDGDGTTFDERGVGLVPLGPLPAGGLQEEGAEFLLAGVEGAGAQGPGRAGRLEGMEDVVDLDEVLAVAGQDVLRGELVRLEAVHVTLVQIEGRAVTVHEPFGHRAGYARGVGDPYRLGDPEAHDLR